MTTYAKLKSGEIYIIWYHNRTLKTLELYPLSKAVTFDPDIDETITVGYDEIEKCDNNLKFLKMFRY